MGRDTFHQNRLLQAPALNTSRDGGPTSTAAGLEEQVSYVWDWATTVPVFRWRDLGECPGECLWLIPWEVTAREQNTPDKCAPTPAHKTASPAWQCLSVTHTNLGLPVSRTSECPCYPCWAEQTAQAGNLSKLHQGLLCSSLHNLLLTHLNQTTAELQWLVLHKSVWGREHFFFNFKKEERQRSRWMGFPGSDQCRHHWSASSQLGV